MVVNATGGDGRGGEGRRGERCRFCVHAHALVSLLFAGQTSRRPLFLFLLPPSLSWTPLSLHSAAARTTIKVQTHSARLPSSPPCCRTPQSEEGVTLDVGSQSDLFPFSLHCRRPLFQLNWKWEEREEGGYIAHGVDTKERSFSLSLPTKGEGEAKGGEEGRKEGRRCAARKQRERRQRLH